MTNFQILHLRNLHTSGSITVKTLMVDLNRLKEAQEVCNESTGERWTELKFKDDNSGECIAIKESLSYLFDTFHPGV